MDSSGRWLPEIPYSARCLVRQWLHEALGHIPHIFYVKEAFFAHRYLVMILRALGSWQPLVRCLPRPRSSRKLDWSGK